MRKIVLPTIICITCFGCSMLHAAEEDKPRKTIQVPVNFPSNWLQEQPHLEPISNGRTRQEDDCTIQITNATPSLTIIGDRNKSTNVIAFADLGTRSIMLRAKRDSQVYKKLEDNAVIKHGDARLPRFDIVGKLRSCAPVRKDVADLLNPVAVVDVESVRF